MKGVKEVFLIMWCDGLPWSHSSETLPWNILHFLCINRGVKIFMLPIKDCVGPIFEEYNCCSSMILIPSASKLCLTQTEHIHRSSSKELDYHMYSTNFADLIVNLEAMGDLAVGRYVCPNTAIYKHYKHLYQSERDHILTIQQVQPNYHGK